MAKTLSKLGRENFDDRWGIVLKNPPRSRLCLMGMLPVARPRVVLCVFAMHCGIAGGQTLPFLQEV